MKYIKLDVLISLLKDIARLITNKDSRCFYYNQWFYAVCIYKFNKKYKNYIITKYTSSYNDYVEFISLDVYKGFTTTLEDYIYSDNEINGKFNGTMNDKTKNDICIYIHKCRSKIIKDAC